MGRQTGPVRTVLRRAHGSIQGHSTSHHRHFSTGFTTSGRYRCAGYRCEQFRRLYNYDRQAVSLPRTRPIRAIPRNYRRNRPATIEAPRETLLVEADSVAVSRSDEPARPHAKRTRPRPCRTIVRRRRFDNLGREAHGSSIDSLVGASECKDAQLLGVPSVHRPARKRGRGVRDHGQRSVGSVDFPNVSGVRLDRPNGPRGRFAHMSVWLRRPRRLNSVRDVPENPRQRTKADGTARAIRVGRPRMVGETILSREGKSHRSAHEPATDSRGLLGISPIPTEGILALQRGKDVNHSTEIFTVESGIIVIPIGVGSLNDAKMESNSQTRSDLTQIENNRRWMAKRRGFLRAVSALGVGGFAAFNRHMNVTLSSDQAPEHPVVKRNATHSNIDASLTNIRGAVYIPSNAWNAWQQWAWYDKATTERELDMAVLLGLNSLRVFASYEYWCEARSSFHSRMDHFLTACAQRNIQPLIILFDGSPSTEPTKANRTATDPKHAFGLHSPSRERVLQPRRWTEGSKSPVAFAIDWATTFASDPRVLATEIMNEPGNVQPRHDFVMDILHTVDERTSDAKLTLGCKDFHFNRVYDLDDLVDIYQFHMNLPANVAVAKRYLEDARRFRHETSKPLWCTEWQRTLAGPSNRFLPDYKSLAPLIRSSHDEEAIDGDFFWSLMLKLAWMKRPREAGRINGVFHPDGSVFDRSDAAAISGLESSLSERRELPDAGNLR